jgi:hypothetical protein
MLMCSGRAVGLSKVIDYWTAFDSEQGISPLLQPALQPNQPQIQLAMRTWTKLVTT